MRSAASATSRTNSCMRVEAAWWSKMYFLQSRSREAQKLAYSPRRCSKRSRSRALLVAKPTRRSVTSFIWASFSTVPSMFAQKAEQPCRIMSTRRSSRRARSNAAEDRVAVPAAALASCEYRSSGEDAPGMLLSPMSSPAALNTAVSSFSTSSPVLGSSVKLSGSSAGSVRGVMPGAMKSRSRRFCFPASSSPPALPSISASPPAWPAVPWLPGADSLPSCSKRSRVRLFRERRTLTAPGPAAAASRPPAAAASAGGPLPGWPGRELHMSGRRRSQSVFRFRASMGSRAKLGWASRSCAACGSTLACSSTACTASARR
mmetsp:Transcript_41659/g.116037  ORF Transcript_41659/g.116037 Transcript_41659/m.116037 type:complete len:318 (+) Transcript_41659:100-1053(+)